ncbi:MAG: hypothetical protein AB4426_21860 [Xenococcaceae cyanobacterium]
MLSKVKRNTLLIRNYSIAMISVILISLGLSEVYYHPYRAGQQQRLDRYSRMIKTGLAIKAQKALYD